MTNIKRHAIAEVFRAAKTHLAKTARDCVILYPGPGYRYMYDEYICYAIENVSSLHGASREAAKEVISDRLVEYRSLETWVIANIPDLEYPVNKDDMQAYRHRWLDALIEEFSQ